VLQFLLVSVNRVSLVVIPAGESIQQDQAGIQKQSKRLDFRLILLDAFAHGNDKRNDHGHLWADTNQSYLKFFLEVSS